jgi:hypothetical protein
MLGKIRGLGGESFGRLTLSSCRSSLIHLLLFLAPQRVNVGVSSELTHYFPVCLAAAATAVTNSVGSTGLAMCI